MPTIAAVHEMEKAWQGRTRTQSALSDTLRPGAAQRGQLLQHLALEAAHKQVLP